jgi:3-hydroxy-9,10-secoandrosta-1,3,5(10)-triene-9,17-dione monooxygenase
MYQGLISQPRLHFLVEQIVCLGKGVKKMTSEQTLVESKMTHAEAIARARALAPAISERAVAAETQRSLSPETIQAFVDASLVRLMTPARWGGHELDLPAFIDSVVEIARADASAGWCYSFYIIHSWMLACFSEQAQRDVWAANPDALMATSFVPAGRAIPASGGYTLSGNWPWSSGVDASSWCMLSALLPASGNEPPELGLFLIPRSDYTILDTWFVAGLKASGSKNVVVENAFIPEHRMTLLSDLREGRGPGTVVHPTPLYQRPFFAAIAPALVAPILGATMGAYEIWRETISKKLTTYTQEQVAMLSHAQIRLAEIEAEIQTARLLLQTNLEVVTSGKPMSLEQRFRCTRNIAYVAKLCVGAIERIFLASGGSANYESNPLQRFWRDIHAMAAHAGLNFDMAGENFGRSELGLPLRPFLSLY